MQTKRKFFNSLESQKIQREKSSDRKRLQRRIARHQKLKRLMPEIEKQAAVDSIAFRFASEVIEVKE